jgi:lipoprotein-releasing system ATP-binding protein
MLLIEINGLTKEFIRGDGRIEVLRGIDLSIPRRQRVAIVGTSGAGKTTLMNILGGLDHPTAGSVEVDGRNIFQLKASELDNFRNRTIGFVYQFHQLLPEFSALENVMMPALINRQSFAEASDRAETLLHQVGLSHRLLHKPGELSGGEQQRVAIARALCMKPHILLADEPTGNLDSKTSRELFDLLNELHQHGDFTMAVVTHNQELAAELDRVIVMVDGRLDI